MIALTQTVELDTPITTVDVDADAGCTVELDEHALESMLQTWGGRVKGALINRYATAFIAADVDDIMAIAVEKLWRNRQKFDHRKGTLKAWFFRIADNVARDVLRYGWFKARKLELAVEQEMLDCLLEGQAPKMIEREDDADVREEPGIRTVLMEVFQLLPETHRKILWADALSSSGVVPAADLARELNLSRGTVRVYRAKALAKLRELLANDSRFTGMNKEQPSKNENRE